MSPPSGMVVHHRNGDRLDNQNRNLVVWTPSYHAAFHTKGKSRGPNRNKRFKGVCRLENGKSKAIYRGKQLGHYKSEIEAAMGYNMAALDSGYSNEYLNPVTNEDVRLVCEQRQVSMERECIARQDMFESLLNGRSQSELAGILQVSQALICRILANNRRISDKTWLKITNAFGDPARAS